MKKLVELFQRPQLPLRWKLLGGNLVTILVILGALVLALFTLFKTTENIKTSNERIQAINLIELTQNERVTSILDYIWSENLARLNEFEIAQRNLDKALANFQPSPLQVEDFNSLKKELTSLDQIFNQMLSLDKANQEQEAKVIWTGQGSKQADRALRLTKQLNLLELRQATIDLEAIRKEINDTAWMISWISGLALLVAICLSFLLTAAVTRPVGQLKNHLVEIAKGDLTRSIVIINQDELGELGATFNTTLESLRMLVKQLYEQSHQVSMATDELNSQARSQVTSSNQQAGAIAQATEALRELNQTAQEIARQALSATQAIEYSLQKAHLVNQVADNMVTAQKQGRAVIARTVQALYNLKQQIVGIEGHQKLLVEQSKTIGKVIELIDSIAKETHLLALNAAIEAAGAGAYGSRFAVIADNVKQLANRSVAATLEVRTSLIGIVGTVQQSNQSAIQCLHEAEQAVEDTENSDYTLVTLAELSEQVKASADKIVEHIEGVANLAGNIGVVTKQQQGASQQMLEVLLSIEAITAQNLSSIRQNESATYQLSSSARELKRSTDGFRLG